MISNAPSNRYVVATAQSLLLSFLSLFSLCQGSLLRSARPVPLWWASSVQQRSELGRACPQSALV